MEIVTMINEDKIIAIIEIIMKKFIKNNKRVKL